MRNLLSMFLALLLLVSCAPSAASPPASRASAKPSPTSDGGAVDWASLARPMTTPALGPGAPCPRSPGRSIAPAFGLALGNGPVYPVGLGSDGVLRTVDDHGMWLQKVLWVATDAYHGPILIRGLGLSGSGAVAFAVGGSAFGDQLRLDRSTTSSAGELPGWREWPSYTAVPRPGCYAYQVDGTTFSTSIVFEAVPEG